MSLALHLLLVLHSSSRPPSASASSCQCPLFQIVFWSETSHGELTLLFPQSVQVNEHGAVVALQVSGFTGSGLGSKPVIDSCERNGLHGFRPAYKILEVSSIGFKWSALKNQIINLFDIEVHFGMKNTATPTSHRLKSADT